MRVPLRLISGGAAQGLVSQLAPRFRADTGLDIEATFGAVGLMKDQLLSGAPCDVVILTETLIAELEREGHVVPGSAEVLGVVRTGLAVKAGVPLPSVGSAADLSALLRGASGVYFPDPVKATAGIHFMKVLKALGLEQALASRMRSYPNGATAMRELAQAPQPDVVGCTQVTEILYTPGVCLVGPLPNQFELATMYSAAVCSQATDRRGAEKLVRLLSSDGVAPLRQAGGFQLN